MLPLLLADRGVLDLVATARVRCVAPHWRDAVDERLGGRRLRDVCPHCVDPACHLVPPSEALLTLGRWIDEDAPRCRALREGTHLPRRPLTAIVAVVALRWLFGTTYWTCLRALTGKGNAELLRRALYVEFRPTPRSWVPSPSVPLLLQWWFVTEPGRRARRRLVGVPPTPPPKKKNVGDTKG